MIHFHQTPSILSEELLSNWLSEVIKTSGNRVGDILYNFVSAERIRKMNNDYLQHDYVTDIITFGYGSGKLISGEIFICPERVEEQAKEWKEEYKRELLRVIVHGVLHLVGYDDRTDEDKAEMRRQEEKSLLLHAQISED